MIAAMRETYRAALIAGLLCALPAWARAGNDDSILLGNDAALTGGAIVATTNDLPGYRVVRTIGLVRGITVRSRKPGNVIG